MTEPGSMDGYFWANGPECRRCGSLGHVITANGLAFIVRCNGCGWQTGLERCEQDARDAWRKIQVARVSPK